MDTYILSVDGRTIESPGGMTILEVLGGAEMHVDAICNGAGTCKKCKVLVDGEVRLACQTIVTS